MPNDDGSDAGLRRTHLLYELLITELIVGRNTIADELTKSKLDQDPYYLMGQASLNVALHSAASALEDSGLIDEDSMRCRDCGMRFVDHDEDTHNEDLPEIPGAATSPEGSAPTKPPSKLN